MMEQTEDKSKHVAIYHPFGDLPDYYSLSSVVKEQMMMLTEHGYTVHFITADRFRAAVPEGVIVHNVLNRKATVEQLKEAAEPIIKQCNNVLTHDIVYLDVYNNYAKSLEKIPSNYIHWSHSAPNVHQRRKAYPGIYVCMNYTDLPLLARQFNIPQGRVRVVYNSVSPDVYFGWHPLTKRLVDEYNLLDCDVLVVYPLDTGRFASKGGYKIIKLINKLNEMDKNAKVLFVNASANTPERRKIAEKSQSNSVIFTSLFEVPEHELYVPRRVVRELFQISNLFPLLSDSEGCSLILLEAALAKNLVVLNEDFPAMKEFGEIDLVMYMKACSTRAKTQYHPNEDAYYKDWANKIWIELENCKTNRFSRKVFKEFNRDWIFTNQLEPLLK